MPPLFTPLKYLLSLIMLHCSFQLFSQQATLSGYVMDAATGEKLIAADVQIIEASQITMTNAYGFYSITVPIGVYKVVVLYDGYNADTLSIDLSTDLRQDIKISELATKLEDVVVTSVRQDANVSSTTMGTNTLSTEQIKKLPVVFGEADVLKAIQLLPGVQSAGEGNSGFYVRGGGPDQNLILLDEAVVYNSGHLFGFFSIFNADAIKKVTLMKGGMTANYGGRLSSVLDVSMKDGNNQSYKGEGGIGLIASRFTFEGPIVKDKGSFIVSARRTYADVVSKPFLKPEIRNNGYFFYDVNLKANYDITQQDKIFLSGYFGRDVFNYKSSSGNFNTRIPWGNATATLRWNRIWNDKLFMNMTAIYNDYDFAFEAKQSNMNIKLNSAIRDKGLKMDFDYYPHVNHKVKFGAQYTHHTFIPNQFSGQSDSMQFTPDNALKKYAHELGIYIMDEFDIGRRLKLNTGIRFSMFTQVGPYMHYQMSGTQRVDSTYYDAGAPVVTYTGWEPRLSFRYQFNDKSSLKASVNRTVQYLHLVSNNGSTLPTDLWVPSTKVVLPQYAWQYSLGYFHNFLDNGLETSIELYYKDLRHQVEYRNGYTYNTGDPEYDFVFGKGYAYGAEFFVNKTQGKFTGWIGYTLAWTWRDFADLNNGKRFPAKYDRRHDLSVVANYEFNDKWTTSAVFIYGTGNAITLPTSFYFVDQSLVQHFSEINKYRVFPYHRLDLSATWTPSGKQQKRLKSSWNFSIYNVYSRLNPYFLFVDYQGSLASGTQLQVKKVSIFPIIPSVTWNFKF